MRRFCRRCARPVYPGHVNVGLEQTDAVHGLEIVSRLPDCTYGGGRGLRKVTPSRGRFEHGHAKMQLAGVPIQIRVCRTVLGELPGDEFTKVAESEPRLEVVVTQRDHSISSQVGWSRISLESHADHDAKVGPGAFHRPQQTRFVFRANDTGRPVRAWYTADAEDLARVDADHNGTDNGVACEPVQPSQVPDAAL